VEIMLRAVTRRAAHGMTGSATEDRCPILSAASSRKGWEWMELVIGAVSHPSRDETARRMGQHQPFGEV
jgi:RNA polymerase subunit RPABC4/transcription elongation factor Spt4